MNFSISLYKSLCVFSNTGLTVCVNTDICTHTPMRFPYQGHWTWAPTHPLGDLWVLVCVSVCVCAHYQCQLCSSAEGLWRIGGEWVEVGGGKGRGFTLFTLAGPAPVRCWNRPRPHCPPPQLGAEHTTAAEQGSSSHPTDWMGTLWREGWPGLVRFAHECWCTLWSGHSLNVAFKESRGPAQWSDSNQQGVEVLVGLARVFAGVLCVKTLWEYSVIASWLLLNLSIFRRPAFTVTYDVVM